MWFRSKYALREVYYPGFLRRKVKPETRRKVLMYYLGSPCRTARMQKKKKEVQQGKMRNTVKRSRTVLNNASQK